MWQSWLCLAVPLLGFVVAVAVLQRRNYRRVAGWAAGQGYDVLRVTSPPFMRPGPFFMQHGRGYAVACIVVRSADGGECTGWVCYPAGLPLLTDSELTHVKVVWDDEWDRNRPVF